MSGAYAIAAPYRGVWAGGFQDQTKAAAPRPPVSVNAPGVNRLGGQQGNAFRRAYQDILGRSVAKTAFGEAAGLLAGRVASRMIPVVGWMVAGYELGGYLRQWALQVPQKRAYIDWVATLPGATVGHAHCDFCVSQSPTHWRRDDIIQTPGPGSPHCIQGCTDFQVPGGALVDGGHIIFTRTVAGPFYWHATSISYGPAQLSGTRFRIEAEDVFMETAPGNVAGTMTMDGTFHGARPGIPAAPPVAFPIPAIMPEASPIHGIPPFPMAIPYRVIPHVRPSPSLPWSVQRYVGNGELAPAVPGGRTKVKPYEVPSKKQVIYPPLVVPGSFPKSTHGTHALAKAEPGTKEKKLMLSVDGSTPAGVVLNGASEFSDFITSIYNALPDSARTAKRVSFRKQTGLVKIWGPEHLEDVQNKMDKIWKHFGEIDWEEAIGNLAWNEVEDGYYALQGMVSKAGSGAAGINAAVLRRAGGVATAPSGRIAKPDWWDGGKSARKERDRVAAGINRARASNMDDHFFARYWRQFGKR